MLKGLGTGLAIVPLVFGAAMMSDATAQSELRERLAAAIDRIETACKEDITKFCGNVSRGEGRILQCMQAHDDQLSYRCDFAVWRASRNMERALNRVERIADACWSDIEKHCADAGGVGRCVVDKMGSLSEACQTVVNGLRQAWQGVASLRGMPAFSSDGRNIGRVVGVTRSPDGKIQSVQLDVGSFLGMGERTVTVDGATIEQLADRINLRLSGEQVRSLPEAKQQ